MKKFPHNFWWGSSNSAEQSEGRMIGDGKGFTCWDRLYQHHRDKFYQRSDSANRSMVLKHFREDIELLLKTGHNAHRTSISWARLIPDGDGAINHQAVLFYREYFTLLKEAGIEPLVCLSHFDVPLSLYDRFLGFADKKTVEAYARYARICFELFGDIVKYWFSFNEPLVSVECGYYLQYHYPLEVNPQRAVQVAYNMALASAKAQFYCKKIVDKGKMGIILNLSPIYPRSNHPSDQKAAQIAQLFNHGSFLDPAVKGFYDPNLIEILQKHQLMVEYSDDELLMIRENTIDILGVNYYQPLRVCAKAHRANPLAPFMPSYYYDHYDMPGKRVNPHRGWEIYPQGLYDLALSIKNNYGNIDWFVAENGIGVFDEERFDNGEMIVDDYRIEFFKEHLSALHKALEQGSRCLGYLVWCSIDSWSWLNGYKNCYGLIALDYASSRRRIKKSGYWFKQLRDNNGF